MSYNLVQEDGTLKNIAGGGGGDIGIEVTQAEYDELKEQGKLLEDTNYYITDAESGGTGGYGEVEGVILEPIFPELTGNTVMLYKFGKVRAISPMMLRYQNYTPMTHFNAFQLPEDSFPSRQIWTLMPSPENVLVDLTLETDGKMMIRFRTTGQFACIPSLVWVVE